MRFPRPSLVLVPAVLLAAAPATAQPAVTYGVGDLILVVDHDRADEQQVMDAYGMALHLAGYGIRVDWWIARDKAYEGIDFQAETDDAPDPATAEADGTVEARDYRAGPFIIHDPDILTAGVNEAWDDINDLRALRGYAPIIHEIRSAPSGLRLNVGFLTFLPRLAYSDNAGIAAEELNEAGLPAVHVPAPGTPAEPATVAGGGLFEGDPDDPCGLRPRYDVFLQDHYDWTDPDTDEEAAAWQADAFLRAGTTCIYECLSATIDDTVHWLTFPPNVATEGTTAATEYTVVPDFADHPFAQTMGPIPIQGGAFQVWDLEGNDFRPTMQNIFYDAVSGDIAYLLGQVDGGKFFFAGGHRRGSVSDRRVILNAVLYEVVSPQFVHVFVPGGFTAGVREDREVRILARGGSIAGGTRIEDVLDPVAELVPGSVSVAVPGGTFAWDAGTRTLVFDLGDVDPIAFHRVPVARFRIRTLVPTDGWVRLIDTTTTYSDAWTTGISFTGGACRSAEARDEFELRKTADRDRLAVGDNDVVLSLVVRNNGVAVLHDVVVTDTLPAGVTYVGPLDAHGRGSADFGVTTPDTLTWHVGWLAPGDSAALDVPVRASPAAAGEFLLNDGAFADGLTTTGATVDTVSDDLAVDVAAGGPAVTFELEPREVAPSTAGAFVLTTRNLGARGDQQGGDGVEVGWPEEWGEPTAVVPPAGWGWSWSTERRLLAFDHVGTNVRWDPAASFAFGFTLVSPPTPRADLFHARAGFSGVPRVFDGDLPVVVRWGTGDDTDGDGLTDDDEERIGTNPDNPDSDGDTIPDGTEVGDPADPFESDDDGSIDALDLDSDDDTIPDADEGLGDPDGDGLANYRDLDSDDGGVPDEVEHARGTDPYDPSDDFGGADADADGGADADADGGADADADVPVDGAGDGSPDDGGPPLEIFGGGGCGCRATENGTAPSFLASLLLGLALLARRRAR
ncbi:MAG: DUF11 domain-containing protein [Deltaproteobacteria bacterium]|nr:DUF11 domain-containing protein [Deltaproteobacteria bacterium]